MKCYMLLPLQGVDARIIIGNFDENMARLVFCHVSMIHMLRVYFEYTVRLPVPGLVQFRVT